MRLFTILLALINRISAGDQFLQIGPILIQWGYISVTTQESSREGEWFANQQLTFSRAFSASPCMLLTDNIGGDYISSNAPNTLTNSGTLIKHIDTRTISTVVTIYWLAIGKA